jgi:hypothetical protein
MSMNEALNHPSRARRAALLNPALAPKSFLAVLGLSSARFGGRSGGISGDAPEQSENRASAAGDKGPKVTLCSACRWRARATRPVRNREAPVTEPHLA